MSVFDKVSELSRGVSEVVSVAASKKEQIGKQLINGFLLFIILLVFGCLDFATLTFHIEYILTASYWGTVFSKTVAGVCAFNIGINLMWEVELMKDTILAEAIILYKQLNKYRKNDFEYFVNRVYNPKEKTESYISQINRRIYLLNKVSRRRDRLLYSSEIPEDAENRKQLIKELEQKKKTNKYCIIRKELEDLKDPVFIKKNLDSLKVKYVEVDATVFDLEIDGAATIHGTKTKGNVTIGKVKASGNVIMGMIGISMFLTAIGLELNAEQFEDQMVAFWHYLLKCATDVGVVLWQTLRGMMKTRKIISSELTQPFVGRNKVLKEYYKWQLDNGKITLDEYNNIVTPKVETSEPEKKDEEYIEVEMTEEQLKALQQGGNKDE